MEPLLKNVFEEFHCRKFYDHCDIQRDFELAKSIKNDGKKKRYFFRPDGRLNTIDKETYALGAWLYARSCRADSDRASSREPESTAESRWVGAGSQNLATFEISAAGERVCATEA